MSIELKQAAQMVIEAYDEFDKCGDYASLLDLEVKMGKTPHRHPAGRATGRGDG